MKVTAYIGILCAFLLIGCKRSENILAPPPSGKSVAIVVNPTEGGINIDADALALDSVGYAFSGVEDLTITKLVEASGRVAGVRVVGNEDKAKFIDAIAKLKKDETLSAYKIFFIESSSSTPVKY